MIIGFDGSRAFSKDKTGTENYSFQLLSHLAKIDTENSYLVYIRPGSSANKEHWPENFKFIKIPYSRLWTQAGLAIQTFKDPLDLLFVPAHTYPLIRKPGLKIIMTVHDLGAEYLPMMHNLKQRLYLSWITNYQLSSASKLIAVSKATKQDLLDKANIDPSKIEVIYEGVNDLGVNKFSSDTLVDIFNKFDIQKRKYFLFVGTIQPRKNLDRIIKSFAAFVKIYNSNLKLVIVGGKGWQYEPILALPKKLGINSQVEFIGRVKDDELKLLYKYAIALIYPSLFEGFGLPILEAFSNSCPVLTSKYSSMPEVAGEAAILVDPYKTENILEGLIKLSEDDTLRDILIQRGKIQLERFNWQKTAQQTLKLFERL